MDGPLNFGMSTTFYPPYHFGGEAMYLYRLTNALAERGHRVTVVHCVDAYHLGTSAGPRGEFLHHPNITLKPLRSSFGWLSPLISYLTGRPGLKVKALDEIFRSAQFDVVHFHLITLFGPAVLEYGEGALRLYTTHDHWFVCPMYDLWKQKRELCETPSCLRCTLSNNRPPQFWRYTNLLERELPRIDLFISPSRSTIEQHRRRGFSHPMRHLPLFLPGSEIASPAVESGATARRPYFLFVGRLVKIKGVHTLFDVFRRYPDADLLIAGDGEYETELRRLSGDMNNVHFLGRILPVNLRQLYRDAIALLVPSLVYETFGFITLESLGQRTPVIARDLGAVAELVNDTGGGITYQTDDDLIDAMRLLQTNPERRNELGQTGHHASATRYSEESHIDGYFAAIRDAAAHRRSTETPNHRDR